MISSITPDIFMSMKIPNAERAQIDPRKLTEYVLNPNHPYGKDKAVVFASALGITSDNFEVLDAALLHAVQNNDAIMIGENDFQ
jgi:hypothetical protein